VITAKARAIALEASIPHNLWPETFKTAGYIANRTPVQQLGWKTPFECVTGLKPNFAHLKVFGSKAYALDKHLPKTRKLDARAHIGYLVGYDSTNIFRIWIPSRDTIIRSRDVTFDQTSFYSPEDLDLGAVLTESTEHILETLKLPDFDTDREEIEDVIYNTIIVDTTPSVPSTLATLRQHDQDLASSQSIYTADSANSIGQTTPFTTPFSTPPSTPLAPAKASKDIDSQVNQDNIIQGKRSRQPTSKALSGYYSSFITASRAVPSTRLHQSTLPPPPKNYQEMVHHQYSLEFRAATEKEYNTLLRKGLYREINSSNPASQANDILCLMWVYTYKFNADGYLKSFKARLVARGDLQSTEEETYAATLAAQTFRAIIAIACTFDLEVRQFDVVAAYSNAELEQPLTAHLPEGFKQKGKCLQVIKALYGLQESALLWLQHLTSTLVSLGLRPVPGVSCLFVNDWLTVLFYVDDIIVAFHHSNEGHARTFESGLLSAYEITPLGNIDHFLGIRVLRDREDRKLYLVQDSYIAALEDQFGIDTTQKTPSTPLPQLMLFPNPGQATAKQIHGYQQKVGKLNYPAIISRPDIAQSVSKLSEFLQNPSQLHIEAANHMIRYLTGTKYRGILFDGNQQNQARAFVASSDASFADNPTTRFSSQGYCFMLFGGLIHWKASKQKTVTTSSTEAELLALTLTGKEYIWWLRLFKAINVQIEDPTLLCDNQQTLRLLQKDTPKLITKLKHVDIHQSWLRQEVQRGHINCEWVPTSQMVADGFTKLLTPQKHANFVRLLNIVDVPVQRAA
jgi:hypothetical protein